MSPTFTEDDVGKRVESASGDQLGVVADVDRETAYVEPEPGIADSTSAALDWGETDDAVPLADDAVDRITDDAIRLEADFPEESIESGTTEEADENRGEQNGEFEGRDVDHDPGNPVEPDVNDAAVGDERRSDSPGTGELDAETGDEKASASPGASDLDEWDQGMDDEFYDAGEGGARVDPEAEMDEPDPGADADLESGSENAETGRGTDPDEMESVESEASREVEVDPSELTDEEPKAEINPGEDVGDRTDVGTDPDDGDES